MDLLKGGALIALVAGFWTNIKTSLWFVLSIFIQRYEIKTEDLHNEIIGYLIQNNKKFNTYDKVFGSQYESFRTGKYGLVAFERYGESMIVFLSQKKFFFKLFRIPFVFSKKGMDATSLENNAGGTREDKKVYSYIVSIRGTVNVAEIIEKAIGTRNKLSWELEDNAETANRFNIYYFPERKQQENDKKQKYGFGYSWYMLNNLDLIGVNQNDLGLEMKNKGSALDNLYFPDEVVNLIDIVSLWIKSKDWYKEKKIPWKKGWLLYGVPGTGKTALARAFAEDLDLPIYVFSLGQMSNNEFLKAWQSMQLNVPCIALMEDIDNVFHKRKNISQLSGMLNGSMFYQNNNQSGDGNNEVKSPLTFDTLLNCLDGVDKTDGIFTIISTNDITKIDEALGIPEFMNLDKHNFISSRPGRIDSVIKLDYINNANKLKMAKRILSEFPNRLEEVKLYISKNIQETPAQFQEYCSQIALEEYWRKQNLYNNEIENESCQIKIAN
ncbi:MAG: ATP-binding protein [Flavobacterium sp.]|nr:ATP-binding protein [Flavobacterium sp.]